MGRSSGSRKERERMYFKENVLLAVNGLAADKMPALLTILATTL